MNTLLNGLDSRSLILFQSGNVTHRIMMLGAAILLAAVFIILGYLHMNKKYRNHQK